MESDILSAKATKLARIPASAALFLYGAEITTAVL
jgi:hypothetical protein